MITRQQHTYWVLGLALFAGLISYFLIFSSAPAFSDYAAGPERKQAFLDYFLPLIEQKNQQVLQTRSELKDWYAQRNDLGWVDQRRLVSLADRYKLNAFDVTDDAAWQELLKRVDVVPPSLALAQAAKESGWGTSRFARKGNNFFGLWCFEPGCGLVPKNRAAEKQHEVAQFSSPEESVARYIHNLNTHEAYQALRDLRAEARKEGERISGELLAQGLTAYSARGEKYVSELQAMIQQNDLAAYD